MVRDQRRFSLSNITCNSVNGLGHGDGFMEVPAAEVPGGDSVNNRYLCGEFASDRAVRGPRLGLPGDRMPLKVRTMTFTTRDIGQSSPYPCAVNTISITLETNVPLLLNSRYTGLDCSPQVTIQGLHGSQTPSSSSLGLILTGSGKFEPTASWTHGAGELIFTVSQSTVAAVWYNVSVELTNRAAPSSLSDLPSAAVTVETSVNGVVQGMVRDGAALSHVFETQPGNAQPLHILAAGFTIKNIGQTTPYPGCLNTITVTIGTNVPLFTRCPTYFEISGLRDDTTRSYNTKLINGGKIVPLASGPISLIGSQHLEHDGTTWANSNRMWWAPGVCGKNDTLGTSYFKERCQPAQGVCTVRGNRGRVTWDNGYVDAFEKSGNNIDVSISGYGGSGFAYSDNPCFISRGTGYTSGGQTSQSGVRRFTVDKKLTMWLAADTDVNTGYVVQFNMRNPVQRQPSPIVQIEGKIGDDSHDLQGHQYLHAESPQGSTVAYQASPTGICNEQHAKHPMAKDSTSVLCCTSCSYASGAVAADDGLDRDDAAPDGQMTTQGDAEPLKVHTPFFCSKYIGQSTPYPCANNTLMVTFVANTFFSANGSVITITGLHGAIAPTGPMDLVDGPNGLGHHNVFSAEAISSDWAVTDDRTRGQGYWDNAAKTLTLYLAVDTDCSTEFVFGFTVTNPSTQQSHQDIQIEASWIADTKQTFKPADPPPSSPSPLPGAPAPVWRSRRRTQILLSR